MVASIGTKMKRKLGGLPWLGHFYESCKRLRLQCVRVVQLSPYDNIYHCCTQKTASQWFRAVLSDPRILKFTGLRVLPYVQLGLKYASFSGPMPPRTIAAHLYIDYPTYLTIPKPSTYRTFFVVRDPRDIIISWYFSARYSHKLIGPIPAMRQDLQSMNRQCGIKYIIDRLEEWDSFDAQRSWMTPSCDSENIRIFRYEDMVDDTFNFLRTLFNFLNISLPNSAFVDLYERYTFENMSGGRNRGVEDQRAQYRKGISGDWQNYFDASLHQYLRDKTGDLLEVLGYDE